MWRHYLVTAMRFLLRNKSFTIINIVGLAVAFAAGLLVLTLVRHELSFDRWIPDHERIVRVETTISLSTSNSFRTRGAPDPVKTIFEDNLPEVITATRYSPSASHSLRLGDQVFNQYLAFVDSTFFDVFDLPFLEGDRAHALADPGSIVLTETTAQKMFGDDSAIGRVLILDNGARSVRVTGIIADMPPNSHFHPSQGSGLEALVPHMQVENYTAAEWGSISGALYLKLKPGTDMEDMEPRLNDVAGPHLPEQFSRPEDALPPFTFSLRPLADIHLAGKLIPGVNLSSGLSTVIGFALVGFVILALATVNFTNLSLARSLQRAPEVALRKVMGAGRGQIAMQFLGESLLVAGFALVIGVALAELLTPFFSSLLGVQVGLSFWSDPSQFLAALALGIVIGIVGGIYPALVASNYRPARLIHAVQEHAPGHRIRAVLTVLQFAVATCLVSCTIIIYAQIQKIQSTDLGYVPDEVVVVGNPGGHELAERFLGYIDALALQPGILSTASAANEPSGPSRTTSSMSLITNPEERINVDMQSVSRGFFETLQISPLYGRLFEPERPDDSIRGEGENRQGALVINESAALSLGFDSAEAALGDIRAWPIDNFDNPNLEIIGIVPDINLRSLKEPVEPTFFMSYGEDAPQYRETWKLLARIDPNQRETGLASIDRLWADMFPDQPVQRRFLDTVVAAQYDTEARHARAFGLAAGTAILIAAMGLYGMAGYSALQRTHEMAMRKVLGARIRDIQRLMLWQFTKPVLVANLIAWPIAFWIMRDWLEGFAYRIDLSAWPFLMAGFAALMIAWVTVSGHALQVARTLPARALRED